jgi:tetratricopeptide (TPR) repeat protein
MLQSVVKLSHIVQRQTCVALLVFVTAGAQQSIGADEGTKSADNPSPSVELNVMAVRSRIIGLDNFRGQIHLHVRITNRSGHPLELKNSQFRCLVDSKAAVFQPSVASSLPRDRATIDTDSVREGWLAFQVDRPGSGEPKLFLEWSSGKANAVDASSTVTASINEAVRSHANIRSKRIGPYNRLAIVEVHRPVDFLSIVPLTEEFGRLKQQNVRGVVLSVQCDDRMPAMFSSGYGWLLSVRIGEETSRIPTRQRVTSSVQFEQFYVTGLQSALGSSYRIRHPDLFHKSRADAVAAALRPVYEQVPLKQALKDLRHPENGVRRAAMEANIDRLNADELRVMIAEAREHGEDDLSLVAANLHRVALPDVLSYLNELVRDNRPKVGAAALHSLVQSVAPGTRGVIRTYWHEAEDSPKLRQRVIEELMKVKESRYPELMAEYTEYQLMAYSTATDADTSPDSSTPETNGQRVTEATTKTVKSLLALLKKRKNSDFVHIARRELLNLTEPAIQDLVVEFVLASGQAADAELVRQYIQQRLLSVGPTNGLTEEQQAELARRDSAIKSRFTDILMTTIRTYPDSAYTERLLKLSRSKAVTGTMRGNAFKTAVTCATDRQRSEIVEQFDALDHKQKNYLLKQYSALSDPRWLGLARQTLLTDPSAVTETVGLLRSDGSPEALDVMIDCLQEIRTASEASGVVAPKNLKTMMQLVITLHLSSYPAARRSCNRCITSHVKQIAELTQKAMTTAYRTNMDRQHSTDARAALDLKREGKYAEALEKLNSIMNNSPWYYNGYISRASLHLRLGSPQLAMRDLKEADRLSPEDPVIQSLIALTDVRLGKTDMGIAMAEKVLKSVPDLATFVRKWTIYNTACVYGRAVELEEAGTRKSELTRRAMDLLLASGNRKDGIDDVHHILNDPDLAMFHQHPDWATFLKIVGENDSDGKP